MEQADPAGISQNENSFIEITLGFQATPMVCHCLTYCCRASMSAMNDFAQAMGAGFLRELVSTAFAGIHREE